MSNVRLSGRLICADESQADVVRRELPAHVALTRAESGCLSFDVDATDDPLVWTVAELFTDQSAFDLHQARVKLSAWGFATSAIKRDYVIDPTGE